MLHHMRDRKFLRMEKLLPKADDYAIITLLIGEYCPFCEQLGSVFPLWEIDNPNPCSETTSGVVPNLQSRESE